MTEQLVNYNITDAVIGEMREKYLRLRIVDLDDKDGAKAVDAARRAVKAKRCEVERLRKGLKADALEWGRKVDSEAKRITEMLLPIEAHLEAEEARIEQERARIKAEEEARAEVERQEKLKRIDLRFAELAKYGGYTGVSTVFQIGDLSEMEFDELLEEYRGRWEKAEAERRAEEQRLEQVRQEQEAERERIAEERRVIEEEKRAMAAEKDRIELERKNAEEALLVKAEDLDAYCEELATGQAIHVMDERPPVSLQELGAAPRTPETDAAHASLMEKVLDVVEGRASLPAEFRYVDDPVGGIPGVICEEIQAAAPDFDVMHQRFQIHASGGHVFHRPNCEKLFSAIGQWIDEIAGEGDTLEIMMFRMTDQQYEDLIRSIDAKDDQ